MNHKTCIRQKTMLINKLILKPNKLHRIDHTVKYNGNVTDIENISNPNKLHATTFHRSTDRPIVY